MAGWVGGRCAAQPDPFYQGTAPSCRPQTATALITQPLGSKRTECSLGWIHSASQMTAWWRGNNCIQITITHISQRTLGIFTCTYAIKSTIAQQKWTFKLLGLKMSFFVERWHAGNPGKTNPNLMTAVPGVRLYDTIKHTHTHTQEGKVTEPYMLISCRL